MPSSSTSATSSPLSRKTKAQLIEIADMTGLMNKDKARGLTVPQLKALIQNQEVPDRKQKREVEKPKQETAAPQQSTEKAEPPAPANMDDQQEGEAESRDNSRRIRARKPVTHTEPADATQEKDNKKSHSHATHTHRQSGRQDTNRHNSRRPSDHQQNRPAAAHRQTNEKDHNSVEPIAETQQRAASETQEILHGILEIMPDGYGFLRKDNYLQGSNDVYVPPQYIRRFQLRAGDLVAGPAKPPRENDRYPAIMYIKEVNGRPPEQMVRRKNFDRLTPVYPDSRFIMETGRNELSTRIIDLVAPIGKGQRGMIVSPPKAGKTIILQKIANSISTNNPEAKLIVLLIDERPEEVTDMQRSINGEVVYSTFDKTPENHVKITELVLERAMRLVELGEDVVILMDSMTRLSRAYNLTINPTGRTLSGGLDPGALYGPKRFFGAARNIEGGGSLTIIATSLIETGSRMDEVIFEEFKGTGNMEVYLDRKLSEKRIFPAIDINKSGTRREELLLSSRELDAVWTIRKAFGQLDTSAVTEMIINLLLKTKDNAQFISSINVSMNDKNLFDSMRGAGAGSSTGNNRGYSASGNNGYNNGYSNGNGRREG